jgi:hypothetical protein
MPPPTFKKARDLAPARGGQAGRILRRDPGDATLEWRDLSPRETEAVDHARAADAAWFEAHPRRSHRLRPGIPHELPRLTADMAAGSWFVVRQVAPGMRIKAIFTPPGPPPDVEEIGHAMFDLIGEHAATGERLITLEEIHLRASLLAAGGRA